ncbi:MAG: histidinol-phosphatase, partial [Clostridiales bacterium]|nr:histidinol-phosphatase [Clostridiales bacterium]
ARATGKEYVSRYIDAGYQGIFVTEHFFRGNTNISSHLPWKEKIKEFTRGYWEAKNLGIQKGLDVFFGWEENYFGAEFLIYGLEPDWLINHPQAAHWSVYDQFHAVHEAGGCVIQAHPFRDRFYISEISLYPQLVHGIEGYNAGNELYNDAWTLGYGKDFALPLVAGTDIHTVTPWREDQLLGVVFDQPLANGQDYAKRIRTKQPFSLRLSQERLALSEKDQGTLHAPIRYYDKHAQSFVPQKTAED